MPAGTSGRLLSSAFLESALPQLDGFSRPPAAVDRALAGLGSTCASAVGPASPLRAIAEGIVLPLVRLLDLEPQALAAGADCMVLHGHASGRFATPFVVLPWGCRLDRAWRAAVARGIAADARWAFACNGAAIRLVDARRTWDRHFLEIDLATLQHDEATRAVVWSLFRRDSLSGHDGLLPRAIAASERHGISVCRALGDGVLTALDLMLVALSSSTAGKGAAPTTLFDQALIVLYRVLFLFFAEARGLVPVWHPVYRDRYTLDAIITALLRGGRCRGVWAALQAISQLAHTGCHAGELRVPAFNGRLFAPAYAPVLHRVRIDDETASGALLAVGTTRHTSTSPPERIAYRDLDVEQLGAVYEHVLDYEPRNGGAALRLERTRDVRKASGTFYTPRVVTQHVVRETLAPLVRGQPSARIRAMRVLDPAMGSGAFLVAACRYLASALEEALVAEGRWHEGEVTAADRSALRREIAQKCLFGVDLNPMAVQLARLSLWLCTLAADKPLTFLDHHLLAGDSLVGAAPDDLRRQPGGAARRGRPAALPLFEGADVADALRPAIAVRLRIENEPDESADIVRRKESALEESRSPGTGLARWSSLLDMWCAGWFWPGAPLGSRLFAEVADHTVRGSGVLPAHVAHPFIAASRQIAEARRFLHWPLAFPEVFTGVDGCVLPAGGFDAVIGNPPWDMVRGDSGEAEVRASRRADAKDLTRFFRCAGVYRSDVRSHLNRYQLFVERALHLARPGGRIGLVLPSGLLSDAGSGPLRRFLFERAALDRVAGLDNRKGLFPVHRSVRFVLLTATAGSRTERVNCHFGLSTADDLERSATTPPVVITRRFLERVSGPDDLGVPEFTSPADIRIVEAMTGRHPWLSSPGGWHVQFGRELNATEDRDVFEPYDPYSGRPPVLEGKQVEPFRVNAGTCRYQLRAGSRRIRLAGHPRLAYRDVASATNRLTLIAAIVPARAVTTHTLFCLKTLLPEDAQAVLCALLNSFVANYILRLRVTTHVTVALVARLPVPAPVRGDAAFRALASLSRLVAEARQPVVEMRAYAELQARAARLYGLGAPDFVRVLETFPLISADVRELAFALFRRDPADV